MNQNRETDYIIHSVTFVYRGTTLDRQLNPNDQAPQNYIKTCQHKLGCRQKYLKTTLHWVCSLCFGKQFAITGHLQWHNPKSLDQVESQALHFISGGMRSTPTTACGIDVDIEPLGLRREGAVIEMVERFKRSDQDKYYAELQTKPLHIL